MCRVLSPHLLVFSLLAIWSALDADAILSVWALKLNFRSQGTPSHRTIADGLMTVPFEDVVGHSGVHRRQQKRLSSDLETSNATALLSPHSRR